MTDDLPNQFPAYKPPQQLHVVHPNQAKILLKVFKSAFKHGKRTSLTIRKRKKVKVI